MKKKDKKKLHELSDTQLKKRIESSLKEAQQERLNIAAGKTKDVHAYSKKRKEVATLLTIQRTRQLQPKVINKNKKERAK